MVQVMRDKTTNVVKEIKCSAKPIRAIYKKVGDAVKQLFCADLIYYGFTPNGVYPEPTSLSNNIVGRMNFGPIKISNPKAGSWFLLFIPVRYDDGMTYIINDMACTPTLLNTFQYQGTLYRMYRFGSMFSGDITIEGRHE